MFNKQACSYGLIALLLVSVVLSAIASAPSASALTEASWANKTTFTSYNSNVLKRVYTNSAGTSTYFIDATGGSTSSIKIVTLNSTGSTTATTTGILVQGATTVTSTTGSTTKNDIMMLQAIGGTTQVLNNAGTTFFAESLATASAELIGTNVNEIHLWLKKTGAPASANMIVAVFDSTCATVYQFGTVDVSTLTTSFVETTFRGAAAGRTLANGDRIGAFFNGGSAGNSGDVEYVNADRYDGTSNTITHTATGTQGSCTPTAQTARELRMQLSYNQQASYANDNDGGVSFWENAGYTVRATQTDSDTTQSLAGTGNSATPPAVLALEKKTTASAFAGASVDTVKLRLAKTGSPTGTISVVEVSATGSTSSKLNQAAGTITANVLNNANFGYAEHLNAGAALIGIQANSLTLGLKKTNSPTGTATFCVLNSSGACTYTFGTLDVSLLTTSDSQYTMVNYVSSVTFAQGDYIGIKYTTGDASNTVTVEGSSANAYDGTASAKAVLSSGLTWAADTTTDLGSSTANTAFKLDLVTLPTVLNTFGTMAASALTTTEAVYTFASASDFTLSSGATTYIGVLYTGGSIMGGGTTGDFIKVARSGADAYDGTTNSVFSSWANGAFSDTTASDLRFRLIDTAQEASDQEASAFIKYDAGSALSVGAVKVYWKDATKIPSSVTLSTSTDDVSYTDRVTVSPVQATGYDYLSFDAVYTVRYVKMTVATWGASDFSIAVGEFQRAQGLVDSGVAVSSVESTGGVQTVWYGASDTPTGTDTLTVGQVNIDTGKILQTVTISAFTGTSSQVGAIEATPNKVYVLNREGASAICRFWSINRDLTGSGSLATRNGCESGAPPVSAMKVITDGASAATDVLYFISARTSAASQIDKWANAASSIGTIGGATTATEVLLETGQNGVVVRSTAGGTESTATINTSTDALSAVLYTEDWITYGTQHYDFTGASARTYKSGEEIYIATSTHIIQYPTTGTFTLTDPYTCFVETLTKAAGLGTVTCLDDSPYYKVSNTLFVSGSGTTWTPRVMTATSTITPTVYSEALNVPLQENEDIINDNVIRLACDVYYTYPFARTLKTGDSSDCTQWTVLDTSSATIGRELPFTTTTDLVHNADYTFYNIHVTLASGEATDFYAQVKYDGKVVDLNYFDATDNVQLRLVYGQCYTLEYRDTTSDELASSSSICADDVAFKEDIIATELGFTFWSAPWGASHTYDTDTHILTTIVHHEPSPYNYTVTVYNGTMDAVVTDSITGADDLDVQTYNLTAFADETPLKLRLVNEDGKRFYDQYIDVGGQWFLPITTSVSTNVGTFEGFGLLMFLPIVFAAIFTRNTAGIGGGMIVAFIGILVVFGLLTLPAGILALITFVAIIGILAYRIVSQ
jgi:hypothetical protein